LTFDKLRQDPQSPEAYGASVTYDLKLQRRSRVFIAESAAQPGGTPA
jgi:NitT/TauT family transport system ATP-binding protein